MTSYGAYEVVKGFVWEHVEDDGVRTGDFHVGAVYVYLEQWFWARHPVRRGGAIMPAFPLISACGLVVGVLHVLHHVIVLPCRILCSSVFLIAVVRVVFLRGTA